MVDAASGRSSDYRAWFFCHRQLEQALDSAVHAAFQAKIAERRQQRHAATPPRPPTSTASVDEDDEDEGGLLDPPEVSVSVSCPCHMLMCGMSIR